MLLTPLVLFASLALLLLVCSLACLIVARVLFSQIRWRCHLRHSRINRIESSGSLFCEASLLRLNIDDQQPGNEAKGY